MSISIDNLPTEVILQILENLDGVSFIYASRVCRRWHQISQGIAQVFWKKVCERDIEKSILEQLCGLQNTQVIKDNDAWKKLYVEWVRGKIIKTATSSTPFTCDVPRNVNCIKRSESWILTGHSNGSVHAWNTVMPEENGIIVQHLDLVADFAVVDLLRSGLYGSIETPWAHHHLISVSYDNVVKLKYLLYEWDADDDGEVIYRHSAVLNRVRVFGDKAVISSRDVYLVFQMTLTQNPAFQMDMKLTKKIIGPVEQFITFNLWRDEIFGIYPDGHWALYSLESSEWKSAHSNNSLCIVANLTRPNERHNHDSDIIFVFRDNVSFFLSAHGDLWISVAKMPARKQRVMQAIQCTITTVTLHGSLLAFGTDSGRLLLYHVPRNVDIEKVDISKPSWNKDLNVGPVTHIDISYEGSSPVIVASGHSKITMLKWHQ